jgi:hypothetical protein
MSEEIKDKYKFMMCLNDALLSRIYMEPESLVEVQPDYKNRGVCHIKHRSGRWLHLRQSVLEVQKIYCETKRRIALEKANKGG